MEMKEFMIPLIFKYLLNTFVKSILLNIKPY